MMIKKAITILLFTISLTTFSQKLTCKDFKEGTFYIPKDSINPFTFKVFRSSNSQTELITNLHEIDKGFLKEFPQYKEEFHETITWINDCTFRLKFDETKMKLTNSMKEMNRNGGLLIEKLKIKGKCFYYTSSMKIQGETQRVNGKICKE